MTTVISDAEVSARLSPQVAVMAMREALIAAYRGELITPPRAHADVMTFTCGRLAGRWFGYRSYDTHVGGEQLVVVHAEPTGELAGIAVGTALGSYRTSALGGAAADALARPDANTVAVVGAGRQAWTQLWALTAVRALTDVVVFTRTAARGAEFAARARAELGLAARTVENVREAVSDRDIVLLTTSSATPVIDAEWLAAGTAVTTVGPKQVGRAEFGPDLPDRADLIVTDSPAQLGAYDPPALLADADVTHLGAILTGEHPGRTRPDEITLYASVGLAGTEPYLLARLLGLPGFDSAPGRRRAEHGERPGREELSRPVDA